MLVVRLCVLSDAWMLERAVSFFSSFEPSFLLDSVSFGDLVPSDFDDWPVRVSKIFLGTSVLWAN